MDQKIEDYVLNLISATREPRKSGLDELVNIIDFGASPRATIDLIKAAKARAFLRLDSASAKESSTDLESAISLEVPHTFFSVYYLVL